MKPFGRRWICKLERLLSIGAAAAILTSFANAAPLLAGSAAIQPNTRIQLLDTGDFNGWTVFVKPTPGAAGKVWDARGGIVSFAAGYTGYLRTEQSYRNFRLHVEWRWPERAGNSGVFVAQSGPDLNWPLSVQVNLKAGAAGELLAQDTLTFVDGSKKIAAAHPAEKAAGEWNTMEIVCDHDSVEATVNGVMQSHTDHVPQQGEIALQLENAAIDFRNVYIEPIQNPQRSSN